MQTAGSCRLHHQSPARTPTLPPTAAYPLTLQAPPLVRVHWVPPGNVCCGGQVACVQHLKPSLLQGLNGLLGGPAGTRQHTATNMLSDTDSSSSAHVKASIETVYTVRVSKHRTQSAIRSMHWCCQSHAYHSGWSTRLVMVNIQHEQPWKAAPCEVDIQIDRSKCPNATHRTSGKPLPSSISAMTFFCSGLLGS
jgi:hypothetical protein